MKIMENKKPLFENADFNEKELLDMMEGFCEDALYNFDELELFGENNVRRLESGPGFLMFPDYMFEGSSFTTLDQIFSSGESTGVKKVDDEIDRKIDYNLNLAKEEFIRENPGIAREVGENNIAYNLLYDLGYGDKAEELSDIEFDMTSEDYIHVIFKIAYYDKNNTYNDYEGKCDSLLIDSYYQLDDYGRDIYQYKSEETYPIYNMRDVQKAIKDYLSKI